LIPYEKNEQDNFFYSSFLKGSVNTIPAPRLIAQPPREKHKKSSLKRKKRKKSVVNRVGRGPPPRGKKVKRN